MTSKTLRNVILIGVVSLIGMMRLASAVRSAPISLNATQKLTVYRGVATISPLASGDSVMELGSPSLPPSPGMGIVSTGDIFFRPGGSTAGAKFSGVSGSNVQDLELTGQVQVLGQICLGGVCLTDWPPAGPGYWQTGTTYDGNPFVRPIDLQPGVQPGVQVGPVTLGSGYEGGLAVVNRGGGPAARLTGDVVNVDALTVYDDVKVQGQRAWSGVNDGRNSGLDADTFEGVTAYIKEGRFCNISGGTGAMGCFCFEGWDEDDGTGYYLGTNVRHCLALTNDFPQ